MTELDTLRPEVREALNRISRNFHISADTDTIRTELLRLAEYESAAGRLAIEKAELRQRAEQYEAELLQLAREKDDLAVKFGDIGRVAKTSLDRAERAEAELAAVRARITKAPVAQLRCRNATWILLPSPNSDFTDLIGERVRLLVDEPRDDNAKEGRSRE